MSSEDEDVDPEMEQELHELSQEIGQKVVEIAERVHPLRIALAGIILLMLLGSIVATWYWVIPRDDVEVDLLYLQRNGHVVLGEIVNDGSREITDVNFKIEFVDKDKELIDSLQVSVNSIPSHTSLSGDQLEPDVRASSVWEQYSIIIEISWTNFRGEEKQESAVFFVSDALTAKYSHDCEEVTWFL